MYSLSKFGTIQRPIPPRTYIAKSELDGAAYIVWSKASTLRNNIKEVAGELVCGLQNFPHVALTMSDVYVESRWATEFFGNKLASISYSANGSANLTRQIK